MLTRDEADGRVECAVVMRQCLLASEKPCDYRVEAALACVEVTRDCTSSGTDCWGWWIT